MDLTNSCSINGDQLRGHCSRCSVLLSLVAKAVISVITVRPKVEQQSHQKEPTGQKGYLYMFV